MKKYAGYSHASPRMTSKWRSDCGKGLFFWIVEHIVKQRYA